MVPTPDPEPTPDPTPVETGWFVWYTADDSAHSNKNIVLGQHVFGSRLEAQQWIDNYADSLLMQGISAANYGASSWNN